MIEKEIWKDVNGYEGYYEVSNLGRVRSLNYNHTGIIFIIKQNTRNSGYLYVNLCVKNKAKKHNVHRLVALTFLSVSNKTVVNHIDGIKTNNNVNNLEWCTRLENEYHAKINKLKASGERHGMAKLTREKVINMRYIDSLKTHTRKKIAEIYNITPAMASCILNCKNWK